MGQSDIVKAALVIAVAAITIAAGAIYFSPYQTCARSASPYGCARALGGEP